MVHVLDVVSGGPRWSPPRNCEEESMAKLFKRFVGFIAGILIIGITIWVILQSGGETPSSSEYDLLIEGIKYADVLLHSYSTSVRQQNIEYISMWGDKLEKPRITEYWGEFQASGPMKRMIRYHYYDEEFEGVKRKVLQSQEYRFDGEKIIETIRRKREGGHSTSERHIFSPARDPFKAAEFDPRYWLTYFGTPIGEYVERYGASFHKERIDGQTYYRLVITRPEKTVQFLISPSEGYRPVEIVNQLLGRRSVVQVVLDRYTDSIWYPVKVKAQYFSEVNGKEVLITEKAVEFSEFEANEDIPFGMFQMPTNEVDWVMDHREGKIRR